MRKGAFVLFVGSWIVAAAAWAADSTFERTLAADPRGSVRISNVAGVVDIRGWDRNQIQVKAIMEEDVDRVDVTSEKGHTTIRVVPKSRARHGEADLQIRVPHGSDLDVSAVSADVQSAGVSGPQRLSTVSGTIRAEFARDFEGKTVSGDLRLKGNSQPGDLRVSTVSGDIVLERGAGELSATTVSGDMTLEVVAATSVRTRTTSGDLQVRGSLARDGSVEAETISGDVTVRVKPEAGFDYQASSFSGDISNCFGKHAQSVSARGPGSRLIGTTGDGKGRVRVKSMSGDVTICNR